MMKRALALAAALLSTTCTTVGFGRLDGVLKGDRPASGDELAEVHIVRGGAQQPARPGMPLLKDDRIVTGRDVRALITFGGSDTEVLLEPESELEILNPSVFLRFGRAILSRLNQLREELKARTEYVVAAPEGTLWTMEVRGDVVTYAVVRGRVRIDSAQRRWEAVVYGPLEQGRAAGPEPPRRMESLTDGEARAIEDTLLRAEKAVGRPRTPFPPATIGERPDEPLVMPEVTGLQVQVAAWTLQRLGLRFTVDRVERPNLQAGTVVRQSPRAGERITRDRVVTLLIATQSPAESLCRVPNVVGQTPAQAAATLQKSRLREDPKSDTQGRRIAKQDPAAGQRVPCGSSVFVAVAREPVIR